MMRTFTRQYMRSVSLKRWPKIRNIPKKSERFIVDMDTATSGKVNTQDHEILALTALSSNEGSNQPAQARTVYQSRHYMHAKIYIYLHSYTLKCLFLVKKKERKNRIACIEYYENALKLKFKYND